VAALNPSMLSVTGATQPSPLLEHAQSSFFFFPRLPGSGTRTQRYLNWELWHEAPLEVHTLGPIKCPSSIKGQSINMKYHMAKVLLWDNPLNWQSTNCRVTLCKTCYIVSAWFLYMILAFSFLDRCIYLWGLQWRSDPRRYLEVEFADFPVG
jgi:hypothetical protein